MDNDYMREYMRNRRRELKAAGYCHNCGRRKPAGTTTVLCPDCNKKVRADWRKRDTERRAAGLCPVCGKRTPAEGRVKCAECLEQKKEYMRRYKRERRRRQKEIDFQA